jgi:hypothetical protein
MDNSMTAIVSLLMIGLGYVFGMAIMSLSCDEEVKKILESRDILQGELDEMTANARRERATNQEIRVRLEKVSNILKDIERTTNRSRKAPSLPPPSFPLERCDENCFKYSTKTVGKSILSIV